MAESVGHGVEPSAWPALTPAEMAAVDRAMAEDLGLDVVQVMELAGRAVAAFARSRFLGGDPRGKRVLVLAGRGGNGGDGLVAARHLLGWGASVDLRLSHPPESFRGPTAHNWRVLAALGSAPAEVGAATAPELPDADLVIDALLGFGLSGPPTGASAALIEAANRHPAPVLAVDLPSGLDGASGEPFAPCIAAEATLTLALPKTGLLVPAARPAVGEIHVADIGVPAAAFRRVGIDPGPIFAAQDVVRLS